MVVFAVQSVIKDPPFTRLDLLTCRNLLIYLEPELQDRLMPILPLRAAAGRGAVPVAVREHRQPQRPVRAPAPQVEVLPRPPGAPRHRAAGGARQPWRLDRPTGSAAGSPRRAQAAAKPLVADLARRSLLQAFARPRCSPTCRAMSCMCTATPAATCGPRPGQPTHNVVDMARDGPGSSTCAKPCTARPELNQPTLDQPVTVLDESSTLAAR